MEDVPVTFEFKGKEYKGFLSQVMGTGSSSTFYLHIPDKEDPKAVWYWGRLRYSSHPNNAGWVFDPTPKTGELESQAEYFGHVVTAWLDSHY